MLPVALDELPPVTDVRLIGGDPAFHVECQGVDGRRDAVERHVDDRGHPACGRGPGRARESLPLGAARFVDVHVRVDETGDQHLVVAQFDDDLRVEQGAERFDDDDPAVPHTHAAGDLSRRGDHPRGTEQQVERVRHRLHDLRRRCRAPLPPRPGPRLHRTRSARCMWD